MVDNSSCRENASTQGLAVTLTTEKNRCIPAAAREAPSRALADLFWELAGTISGTILGTAGFPVT